jgi:hypothetical protein
LLCSTEVTPSEKAEQVCGYHALAGPWFQRMSDARMTTLRV